MPGTRPNPSSQRGGGNGNNNNNKRSAFKGSTDGLDAVLQLPSERQKGTNAQFDKFKKALSKYVGANVSTGLARTWAYNYVTQDDPQWEPQEPTKPDDTDARTKARYERACKAFDEAFYSDWPAAKLEIWSTILRQCSADLVAKLEDMPFYEPAAKTMDSLMLLEVANILVNGGKVTTHRPQSRADALSSLVTFRQMKLPTTLWRLHSRSEE